jgi:hypothetical protein
MLLQIYDVSAVFPDEIGHAADQSRLVGTVDEKGGGFGCHDGLEGGKVKESSTPQMLCRERFIGPVLTAGQYGISVEMPTLTHPMGEATQERFTFAMEKSADLVTLGMP